MSTSFTHVIESLKAGDQDAARRIYSHFIDGLIRLATARVPDRLRVKADPEDIAQSVMKTFFRRFAAGLLEVRSWEMLAGLLSHITVSKALNRQRDLRRQRRDAD